jgi:hypothetical protein
MGLFRDIIESGYVREKGSIVKFGWKGRVAGEDGETKVFW